MGTKSLSLLLLRCVCSSFVLIDFIQRLYDVNELYCDGGVLPRAVVVEELHHPLHFSIALVSGHWQAMAALMMAGMCSAIAFAIGWHTKRAAVVLWVVLCGVQLRNTLVLGYGDNAIRLCLFWAMFVQWDAVPLTLDYGRVMHHCIREVAVFAFLNPSPLKTQSRVTSLPSPSPIPIACLLVQCVVPHLGMCLHRLFSPEWWSGEAVTILLTNPGLTSGLLAATHPLTPAVALAIPALHTVGCALLVISVAVPRVAVPGVLCVAVSSAVLAVLAAPPMRHSLITLAVLVLPLATILSDPRAKEARHEVVIDVRARDSLPATPSELRRLDAATMVDLYSQGYSHPALTYALALWDTVAPYSSIVSLATLTMRDPVDCKITVHVSSSTEPSSNSPANEHPSVNRRKSGSAVAPASETWQARDNASPRMAVTESFVVGPQHGHAAVTRLFTRSLLPTGLALAWIERCMCVKIPRDPPAREGDTGDHHTVVTDILPGIPPTPTSLGTALYLGLAVFFFFVLVLAATPHLPTTPTVTAISTALHDGPLSLASSLSLRLLFLEQRWDLWTPHPPLDSGWFVVPMRMAEAGLRRSVGYGVGAGGDAEGGDYDAWALLVMVRTGESPDRAWAVHKPSTLPADFNEADPWQGFEWWEKFPHPAPSARWQAYMRSLWVSLQSPRPPSLVLAGFGEFLCEWAAATTHHAVTGFDMQFMLENVVVEDGRVTGELALEAVFAWTHDCSQSMHRSYFIQTPK